MNPDRKTLADLFARLHGMGVTAANTVLECPSCDAEGSYIEDGKTTQCLDCMGECYHAPYPDEVLQVLGEMMTVATPGVSMSDVLDAAMKAGVY